jgi:hypothetical protein
VSAIKQVVMTCDGIQGEGCPVRSRAVIQEQYANTARRELAASGWKYHTLKNEHNNVIRHLDVCGHCLLYDNES